MRRKKSEEQQPTVTGGGTRIEPAEVQQVEFRLAFRGYNERDVDAFLDRITEDLGSYIEENQRLRAAAGPAPLAAAAVSDAAVRAQAEEIVARAREEAAAIVREAEMSAAASGVPAGAPRVAVAPFLNMEREFLQSLGSLVQGHAEEVKRMVLALRARSEAGAAASTPAASSEAAKVPTPASGPQAPVVPERSDAAAPATDEKAGGSPDAGAGEGAFAPIRVPSSEDASPEAGTAIGPEEASSPAPASTGPLRDSGERSLRELFWGED